MVKASGYLLTGVSSNYLKVNIACVELFAAVAFIIYNHSQ